LKATVDDWWNKMLLMMMTRDAAAGLVRAPSLKYKINNRASRATNDSWMTV
jgi:hypothetical protein